MRPQPSLTSSVAVSTLAQAEHGADRKIDAGGDDDEGHAERDDAGFGDRADDVGDVVEAEKQDVAVPARREDDAADRPPR